MKTITVKLGNPRTVGTKYLVDVLFKSDVEPAAVFAMNVRLFFDSSDFTNVLRFTEFQAGYGATTPNPPQVMTAQNSTAKTWFAFTSAPTWVNGAIILNDKTKPVPLSIGGWAKIFSIEFTKTAAARTNPPIVLDLEFSPSNGGYLPGSEGIVITTLSPIQGRDSDYARELVEQYNWAYVGDGTTLPYGKPV